MYQYYIQYGGSFFSTVLIVVSSGRTRRVEVSNSDPYRVPRISWGYCFCFVAKRSRRKDARHTGKTHARPFFRFLPNSTLLLYEYLQFINTEFHVVLLALTSSSLMLLSLLLLSWTALQFCVKRRLTPPRMSPSDRASGRRFRERSCRTTCSNHVAIA